SPAARRSRGGDRAGAVVRLVSVGCTRWAGGAAGGKRVGRSSIASRDMDDVTGGGSAPGGPRPDRPDAPDTPDGPGGRGPQPPERSQGLILETCYRHPQQFT